MANLPEISKPELELSRMKSTLSYQVATEETIDGTAIREFLGSSISDGYRLKSELVGKAFSEIGMGRYQWELFVVTGFGYFMRISKLADGAN